jgi:flagellar biosynthesis/type III secretory pathway M-ring protein FliF/YscJ
MESLRKAVAQVMAQMRDMTLSQRLAILLGAVLVAVSVVWIAHWAAAPEMVPLLAQDLKPDELAALQSGLAGLGETFKVSGNRVLVPASANRQAILARLQQDNHLPSDTSAGFAALVKEANPWISQDENRRRWTVALQSELENVLRTFSGVRQARVFLNVNSQVRLVERNPSPQTASVTLEMRSGEPVPRPLAMAAARLVAGAVSGLTPDRVEVVDSTGRRAWSPEDDVEGGASQLHQQQLRRERELTEKIRAQLSDPYARVAVRVGIDFTTRRTTSDEPTSPVELEAETTSTITASGRTSGQPGVPPNTGVVVGTGVAEERSESTTNRTRYQPGWTSKEEVKPSGDVNEVYAAISLSDVFLASVFRRANPDGEEPTVAQLEQVFEQQKARIVSQVEMLVKGAGERMATDRVAVDWHYELPMESPVMAAGAIDSAADWARRYGPQSGLAALALVSLGLMLRLARKTQGGEAFGLEIGLPQEAIDAAKAAAADVEAAAGKLTAQQSKPRAGADVPVLTTNVAQSQATEGVLVAQEVDESTIQINKMVEQVTKFVDKDPETVANLLERWVQSGS